MEAECEPEPIAEVVVTPVKSVVVSPEMFSPALASPTPQQQAPAGTPEKLLLQTPEKTAFETPSKMMGPVSTPQTVKAGDSFSLEDDDDVILAPSLSKHSVPDYVKPSVTSSSPVLPDDAWLTPPRTKKTPVPTPTSARMSPGSVFSPVDSDAASNGVIVAETSFEAFGAPSVLDASGGNPNFTPLKSPEKTDEKLSSAPSPVQAMEPLTPTKTPEKTEEKAFFEAERQLGEGEEREEDEEEEEHESGAGQMNTFAGWGEGLLSPIREETDEYAVSIDHSKEALKSPLAGNRTDTSLVLEDKLVSELETSETAAEPASEMVEQVSTEVIAESIPEDTAQEVAPATPVSVAPGTPVQSIAASAASAMPPLATADFAPAVEQSESISDVPSTPKAASPAPSVPTAMMTPLASAEKTISVPDIPPVTPFAFSPDSSTAASAPKTPSRDVTTPLGAAAVSPMAMSTPKAMPESTVGLQAELDRIKQKIRVWDVTSPAKTASPSKYTAEDANAVKAAAETSALAESTKLREEFAALKTAYEKEQAVSRQFKEVVDEYESTLRVLVEGHTNELERERAVVSKLQQDNAELMSLVDDNQRKADALEADQARARVDLEAVLASKRAAEAEKTTTEEKLNLVSSKYQALKQQAEQKLTLANERIAQQTSVNTEQIALMKGKLAAKVSQLDLLSTELAGKKKENLELVSICDTLVSQLEATK